MTGKLGRYEPLGPIVKVKSINASVGSDSSQLYTIIGGIGRPEEVYGQKGILYRVVVPPSLSRLELKETLRDLIADKSQSVEGVDKIDIYAYADGEDN